MIFPTVLQSLNMNINQNLNSQNTPNGHTSASRMSYGVSVLRIGEKIDRIIMALHFDMSQQLLLS